MTYEQYKAWLPHQQRKARWLGRGYLAGVFGLLCGCVWVPVWFVPLLWMPMLLCDWARRRCYAQIDRAQDEVLAELRGENRQALKELYETIEEYDAQPSVERD